MRKISLLLGLWMALCIPFSASAQYDPNHQYITSVTFPANFAVGDYIEFVRVYPANAAAAGNYEISITYTRGNIAAAATHLASISHSNPTLWREVGRVNANGYIDAERHNFTVDCNTEYGDSRFRIRAINTFGISAPITVNIKIRSINFNDAWMALNATGNDLTVSKRLPMTNEWDLLVGNPYSTDDANIAFKVKSNGNVGIGTINPTSKLAVKGTIQAEKVKVTTDPQHWPDYVFAPGYRLPTLQEWDAYIQRHRHLPGIPSATEVGEKGQDLGEMNRQLLQKVEELTLHLIAEQKARKAVEERLEKVERQLSR